MAVLFEETGIVVKSYQFECLNIEIWLHQNFEWLKSAPTNLLAPNSWVVKDLILYLILHVPFLHGFESYLQSFSQFLADKVYWWLNSWTTVIWRWIKLGSPQNLRYHPLKSQKITQEFVMSKSVLVRNGTWRFWIEMAGNQWRWATLLLQEMESASWTAEYFRGVVFPWQK